MHKVHILSNSDPRTNQCHRLRHCSAERIVISSTSPVQTIHILQPSSRRKNIHCHRISQSHPIPSILPIYCIGTDVLGIHSVSRSMVFSWPSTPHLSPRHEEFYCRNFNRIIS